MSATALFRGSAFAQLPRRDSLRAHRQVRLLRAIYNLDHVHDTDDLVAHVQRMTGVVIRIEPLPIGYPPQITGLISLVEHNAVIHLPREHGIYPAHVLFHEVAHLLMWDAETRAGRSARASLLACSDDYVEFVAEALAQHLSTRLLRIRTPHIERILG